MSSIVFEMSRKSPKELVQVIANQVGKPKARELLREEGLAKVTADRLVRGTYEPEVKRLVQGAIERAFARAKVS